METLRVRDLQMSNEILILTLMSHYLPGYKGGGTYSHDEQHDLLSWR